MNYDSYKCVRNFKVFRKNGKYMGFYDGDEAIYTIYDAFGGSVTVDETEFNEYFVDITEEE